MLFNSFSFLLFLPIVFLLYWFVFNKHVRLQNSFIVLVSYVFYGWWDWRFLSLIAFTTFCSWFSGLLIKNRRIKELGGDDVSSQRYCKIVVAANILVNLSILAYFWLTSNTPIFFLKTLSICLVCLV